MTPVAEKIFENISWKGKYDEPYRIVEELRGRSYETRLTEVFSLLMPGLQDDVARGSIDLSNSLGNLLWGKVITKVQRQL